MDAGRFESVAKVITSLPFKVNAHAHLQPYAFHKVMRSMFMPLQLATDARGLEFETDLDTTIDDVSNLLIIRTTKLTDRYRLHEGLCMKQLGTILKMLTLYSRRTPATQRIVAWLLVMRLVLCRSFSI